MEKYIICIIAILLVACQDSVEVRNYRVKKKDNANFSVITPELQPEERIVIKINGDVIWDELGKGVNGNPGAWRYFKYPGAITRIEFLDHYKNVLKINKEFNDTLKDARQRTLIISRTYPKYLKLYDYKRVGVVSIDTGLRSVQLLNDAVAFKGTWTDSVD
jgi:hypothetical protein